MKHCVHCGNNDINKRSLSMGDIAFCFECGKLTSLLNTDYRLPGEKS